MPKVNKINELFTISSGPILDRPRKHITTTQSRGLSMVDAPPIERHVPPQPVQYAAGFRLLDKFKTQWEELHQASESNIKKTQLAIRKIHDMDKKFSIQLESLESFINGYKSLSNLEDQIGNIQGDLTKLEHSFVEIERCLFILTEEKQKRDTDKFLKMCKGNLETQIQREKVDSELRKDKLMSEHLQRVQNFESQQQNELRERRLLLEKEFQEEKNRYLQNKQLNNKMS